MIYEYALEPELVASWYDYRKYQPFADKFGFEAGRIVSHYPGHWEDLVLAAFGAACPKPKPVEKKRLMTLLTKTFRKPVVDRSGCPWDENLTWLDNAEKEHARRPFHAILVR